MEGTVSPKISVIVLTYNQEDTVARTLDSILAQQCSVPFEIVIGDDASTDRTVEICRRYAAAYPDVIRLTENKTNKGILNNYYDCVLSARGEYIADVAGDDFWIDPDKLQSQVDILDSDSEVVLVHTDWQYFDEKTGTTENPWEGGKYPYVRHAKPNELTAKLLEHARPLPVHLCTAMYRKKDFLELYADDESLFRNKEFVVEDLQLLVMLSTKGKIVFLDRVTLSYGRSEKSVTSQADFVRTFDIFFASMQLTRYLEKKLGFDHERLLPTYRRFYHFILMQAIHAFDGERRNKILGAAREWDVKPPLKSRVAVFLSANRTLWHLMFRKDKSRQK